MSKEKNTKQMSLLEDFPANPSASQVNKKEQTTTAISGQKCLDSLGRSNPNSLLGRMCKDLLTSKTAWYSDRCKTTWKVKVSKSNVSLFQLQASVLGTKDIESGLWATPNTMDYLPPRSAAGTKKIMEGHRKGRTKPSNLREQVDPETMKIYQDMGQVEKHLRSKKQSFPTPTTFDSNEINKPRKPHPGGGQKPPLNQVVKMYPTPTQDSASERTKKYKQGGTPLTVAVQEEVKMYPTPNATNIHTPQSERVERTKSGGFILRKKKKTHMTYGARLQDAMEYLEKMYPTPTARDYKDLGYQPTWKPSRDQSVPRTVLKNNKPGGKLNPTFVEFLMGFPMNWTKTELTESKPSVTQSSHKSQESSDSQSKKFYPTPRANEPGRTTKGYGRGLAELMEGKEQVEPKKFYRTPTAMDKGDNSFKYAAKILKGKLNRSESKQPVQKTLSMDVAMEHLKNNQHLINEYDEKFKTRPHLPSKDIFLEYLRNNLDKKKLVEDDIIKKTTIDHWLRSDHCFAYPTVEYWNMIKPYLKEIRFDKEMTTETESDWE